jgi:hypothetical protein
MMLSNLIHVISNYFYFNDFVLLIVKNNIGLLLLLFLAEVELDVIYISRIGIVTSCCCLGSNLTGLCCLWLVFFILLLQLLWLAVLQRLFLVLVLLLLLAKVNSLF